MPVRRFLRSGVSLALVLSLVPGCTTLRPVVPAEPSAIYQQVSPGDTVRVVTREGGELEFEVRQVTDQALEGDGVAIPLDEVTQLEKRALDREKTAWTVIVVTSLILGALALYALSNAAFMPSGGP